MSWKAPMALRWIVDLVLGVLAFTWVALVACLTKFIFSFCFMYLSEYTDDEDSELSSEAEFLESDSTETELSCELELVFELFWSSSARTASCLAEMSEPESIDYFFLSSCSCSRSRSAYRLGDVGTAYRYLFSALLLIFLPRGLLDAELWTFAILAL